VDPEKKNKQYLDQLGAKKESNEANYINKTFNKIINIIYYA
jgi:hypothetical protein